MVMMSYEACYGKVQGEMNAKRPWNRKLRYRMNCVCFHSAALGTTLRPSLTSFPCPVQAWTHVGTRYVCLSESAGLCVLSL